MGRSDEERRGMLSGMRILDLTRVMSGPYCTAMLAELGAEVIKIEAPNVGDGGRHFGPYVEGESSYFSLLNRGKKSICVDLKHPEGAELVRQLAAGCDVLVENFRPGVMARLGLDYERLQVSHPGLVYASISGFGEQSPFAHWPAFDLVIQAMSGLMSVTGPSDGAATAVGESIADVCTGIFASWGILAALVDRSRSGRGRHVDVAMLDSVFSMMLTPLSRQLYTDKPLRRAGNRHPETYPVDSFSAKDGDLVLVCFSEQSFDALCQAMGKPELAEDPRFVDNAARNRNESRLRELIAGWTKTQTRSDLIERLHRHKIPAAPIWSLDELRESGHLQSRGMLRTGRHPKLGDIPLVPQPVRFSGYEPPNRLEVPGLGQHSEEVLSEHLGLGAEQIARLKDLEVIVDDKG